MSRIEHLNDKVTCAVCGREFRKLGWTHLKTHGITTGEYREMYPGHPFVSDRELARMAERTRGNTYVRGTKLSEEHKRKIGDANRGEKNGMYSVPSPMLGRHQSEEAKHRLSLQRKGVPTGRTGEKSPMYGRRGDRAPNWKGGLTSEKQLFYSSLEWKHLREEMYERDGGTCQLCNKALGKTGYHVHHKVSIDVKRLRLDPDNCVLLCEECHTLVHKHKSNNHSLDEWDDRVIPGLDLPVVESRVMSEVLA